MIINLIDNNYLQKLCRLGVFKRNQKGSGYDWTDKAIKIHDKYFSNYRKDKICCGIDNISGLQVPISEYVKKEIFEDYKEFTITSRTGSRRVCSPYWCQEFFDKVLKDEGFITEFEKIDL